VRIIFVRIATVVGARPQFVKAAVVSREFAAAGISEFLIHTGQHYDASLSDIFFDELAIPAPKYQLAVGSGNHGAQTGLMMQRLEVVFEDERPDVIVVYGDTNSTLAAALTGAKMHIPIAHVEAGLRSFNRAMPEEINRVMTDHISEVLFAPTKLAVDNLSREGITESAVHLVGDVMFDVARLVGLAATHAHLPSLDLVGSPFVLATIHRAENTDDEERLTTIVDGLTAVSQHLPVVFPIHPRTRSALAAANIDLCSHKRLHLIDPVGYRDMLSLQHDAAVVVTDSGGIQKEAFFQRTPCVTLRDQTEWTELIDLGWNVLVPPSSEEVIVAAVLSSVGRVGTDATPYGDGDAARRIAEILLGR
jgi:UDP-GlcNAc3NAcA epimerase